MKVNAFEVYFEDTFGRLKKCSYFFAHDLICMTCEGYLASSVKVLYLYIVTIS